MPKSKCPHCRKELDFHEMQFEADLRAALELTCALGKNGHLAMAYCYLFGVTPFRLKAKKLRLLLEELKRLIDAQAFNYQKKTYYITQAGIAEALDIVIKKHFETPLDSHNYLKKITIGISEREARGKSKSEEKELKSKEETLRQEQRPNEAQVKENIKRIVNLVDSIGGKVK